MLGFGTTPHNNRHRINQCWDQVIRWQHTLYYNQSNCTSWKIKNCKSLVNRCCDLLISPPNISPLSHKYHYQSTIVSSYGSIPTKPTSIYPYDTSYITSASLLSPVLHHISIPAQPNFSHQKSNHLLQIATFYTSNMAQYPYPTP